MKNQDSLSEDEMITEINITPFVDVVLVLLILFMLAAPVVYQTGIRVQLPSVVAPEKLKHITLRFMLNAKSELWIDQEKIPKEHLSSLVKKAFSLDARADAIIVADKAIQYEAVLELINLIREAGIREIALGAQSKLKIGR